MPAHPLIAGHGPIGDLQTSASVATDGLVLGVCASRAVPPSAREAR